MCGILEKVWSLQEKIVCDVGSALLIYEQVLLRISISFYVPS